MASADDAIFCGRLKEVVDHTKKGFSDIAGDQIDEHDWSPSVLLPFQKRCYISKSKTINYICQSNNYGSKAEASKFADEGLQRASKCLGKLWTKQDRRGGTHVAHGRRPPRAGADVDGLFRYLEAVRTVVSAYTSKLTPADWPKASQLEIARGSA